MQQQRTITIQQNNHSAIPLILIKIKDWKDWFDAQSAEVKSWITANQFVVKAGKYLVLPETSGNLVAAIVITANNFTLSDLGNCPKQLPYNDYQLELFSEFSEAEQELILLSWGMGSYQFDRYKKIERKSANLATANAKVFDQIEPIINGVYCVRDLVNITAEDLGPGELATVVADLAKNHQASFSEIKGKELLTQNFPAIYAVGRSSYREPRLLNLTWGNENHPKVVLIGKGVCFDSGGLNLKLANSMALMKKDMGGAAHAIALAQLIMQVNMPIHLSLLLPVVENAIDAESYRPGDVLNTRNGTTVEVGNTDAEGRLILADALTYGCEFSPDLMIDFATLTGAARVALGTDLPATFANNKQLLNEVWECGDRVQDSVWPMPLHKPYKKFLESNVADLNNIASRPFAGAVTAALFLEHFVDDSVPWCHLDTYAWNYGSQAGRPAGGEAQGLRAIYRLLTNKYQKN